MDDIDQDHRKVLPAVLIIPRANNPLTREQAMSREPHMNPQFQVGILDDRDQDQCHDVSDGILITTCRHCAH